MLSTKFVMGYLGVLLANHHGVVDLKLMVPLNQGVVLLGWEEAVVLVAVVLVLQLNHRLLSLQPGHLSRGLLTIHETTALTRRVTITAGIEKLLAVG